MKVLNVTHVMQYITVDQFDDVVENIIDNRYLGFSDAELPIGKATHKKTLHIYVTCMDTLLCRVLVDTSSSLNVIPKNILSHQLVDGAEIRASALIIRAFDGSRRQLINDMDLPIQVGPHLSTIMFPVMEINLPLFVYLGDHVFRLMGK